VNCVGSQNGDGVVDGSRDIGVRLQLQMKLVTPAAAGSAHHHIGSVLDHCLLTTIGRSWWLPGTTVLTRSVLGSRSRSFCGVAVCRCRSELSLVAVVSVVGPSAPVTVAVCDQVAA